MITKGSPRNLLANIACLFPVERLYGLFEKIRLKRLRKNLKFCGERVVLRQDFLVMAPEKLYIDDDVSFAVKVSIMGGVLLHRPRHYDCNRRYNSNYTA